MNKIYRTVYNETTGTWVAVCETAKTHTKSSGKSSVVKAVAAVSMAAVAGVAMAGSVVATNTEPVSVTGSDTTTAQRLKLEAMIAAFNSLAGMLTKNADGSYSHNGTVVINADGTLTTIGQTRIPHKVKIDALSQVAVGDNAHSNKDGAVAVGSNSYAGGAQSVAVGMGASSNGGGAVAIGGGLSNGTLQGAVANGNGAISLGVNALAQGNNAFAAAGGHAQSNNTISIGVRSIADGEGAIAFGSGINQGNNAGSYAKGEGTIAIGKRAEAVRATVTYEGEKGNYTLPQNVTTDPHGHQYTYNRQIIEDSGSGAQIIAIGDNASAYGNQSIALGGNSVAAGYASIAIGGDDIGSKTNNRDIINYLTGTLATELSTGGFDTPTAITNLSKDEYYVNLTTAKGEVSTAFGIKAVSEGNLSNAYGVAARSVGLNSNAFGTTSFAGGDESIAFGTATRTAIGADYATSIGYMSQIGEKGVNSVALGAKNKVTETNSAAIGQNNTVGTADTFVLGNNVSKTLENSVYLGAGSTTATTGARSSLAQVNRATVGGITYGATLNNNTGFAGHTPTGIVSVGSDTAARRIQNVAAGAISEKSTDAINGSQLWAVLPKYTTDASTGNVTSVQVGDKTYNFAQGGGSGENNWNLTVNGDDTTITNPSDKRNLTNNDGNINIALDPTGKEDISFDLAKTVTIGTPQSKDPASSDKPVVIDGSANGGSITFTKADGATSNTGVIDGVASHLQDPASKDGQDKEINSANAPTNFTNNKNEAATVGDVLNAGWNLQ
ncbi:MAG: hypothetical protein J6T41_04675, partial [Neisseriaceae bacterium]|nr:hypothetical protein [Neisseriaceae bacterium]